MGGKSPIRSRTMSKRAEAVLQRPLQETIRRKQLPFNGRELKTLKKLRAELILEGLTDWGISKRIAGELRSTPRSIDMKIRQMVAEEELPENPNRQSGFTWPQLRIIKERRESLIYDELNDRAIAQIIAHEINARQNARPGDRKYIKPSAVYDKIRKLVKQRKLRKNPNNVKWKRFRTEEIEIIKFNRPGLIAQGMNDTDIARRIAIILKRKVTSVESKIGRMVKNEELPKNPNNETRDEYDIDEIRRIRRELIFQGLNDSAIVKQIAEQTGKNAKKIGDVISKRVRRNDLVRNPHNRPR